MLNYAEKAALLAQFKQLALCFTASEHPVYKRYFCAWFTEGVGQKYEKFVTEFNMELKNFLIKFKAESSFKDAIYGNLICKADGSRNWYPEFGLVQGESILLFSFFENYPEVARFFQRKFSENFSLFLEMNAALTKFSQEIDRDKELKSSSTLTTNSFDSMEMANVGLRYCMQTNPQIFFKKRNISNESVELCLPGNKRVKTTLDEYLETIYRLRSESPVLATDNAGVNETQLQLLAKGLVKFGFMAHSPEKILDSDNDPCPLLQKLAIGGCSTM